MALPSTTIQLCIRLGRASSHNNMPSTTDEFRITLRDGDPLNPPREGRRPIDNLPNELLSYVFQLGVEVEQEEGGEDSENQWKDVDEDSDAASVNSSDSMSSRVLPVISDLEDDQHLPFQVLVSHVCRHWRSVALNTRRLWTTLTFWMHPGLAQAKEYISRSNGLPLTIELDCYTDDHARDDLEELEDMSEDEEVVLSLEELDQILDLLEPAVSQWGKFTFYASRYIYVLRLMSRLAKFPAAPCLESFWVHRHKRWDNTVFVLPGYKTRYLPFNGRAPNLKEAVFWGIHIDWEGALPNFLRGLRCLELSYLKKDVRPTYAAFAEIIKNSPELRTLTLSIAGPIVANDVAFDSVPLAIPSLTELVLRLHDQEYATDLVQHLDIPNVTHLVLEFNEGDYSDFVQTLAKPVKGRDQSLLRQISHLEMSGLTFHLECVEVLLTQLISLKSLNLQPSGRLDEVICDALVNPWVLPIGPASVVDIPEIFCPKLEEITMRLDDESAKALITGRRDAGVPLKRIRNITY